MRREQFLVDSCYSNSDANDGKEGETSDVHLQKTSSEHLFVSACVKAVGACEKRISALTEGVCKAWSAHMWLKSVVSVFAARLYLRHAQH